MNKQDILFELQNLVQPIITNLVVFDEGCEFFILTQSAIYKCLVGGAFPIIGPIKLPKDIHESLIKHLSGVDLTLEGRDAAYLELMDTIVFYLGSDALKEMFKMNWKAEQDFYVFHNMGWDESSFFTSLDNVYRYFIEYYATDDKPVVEKTSWDEMTDDEILEWADTIEAWRSSGRKIVMEDYFGSFYSPWIALPGHIQIAEFIHNEISKYI